MAKVKTIFEHLLSEENAEQAYLNKLEEYQQWRKSIPDLEIKYKNEIKELQDEVKKLRSERKKYTEK